MAPKRTPIKGLGDDAYFSSQPDDKTISQHAVGPASQLVKATFYLTPELVMKLEEVRMERLRKGLKVDKSALVREAIAQLPG